jgi:hypothetical protein
MIFNARNDDLFPSSFYDTCRAAQIWAAFSFVPNGADRRDISPSFFNSHKGAQLSSERTVPLKRKPPSFNFMRATQKRRRFGRRLISCLPNSLIVCYALPFAFSSLRRSRQLHSAARLSSRRVGIQSPSSVIVISPIYPRNQRT